MSETTIKGPLSRHNAEGIDVPHSPGGQRERRTETAQAPRHTCGSSSSPVPVRERARPPSG